jgi:two-component system chemotaxis sensor kinase CheA
MPVIDLKQFYPTFFTESLSGLDAMEADLLHLEKNTGDSEKMDAIFRAIHSVKGASGTFGFNEITQLSHVMETLLDEMRHGKLRLTAEINDAILQSVDCLRAMIIAEQSGVPASNPVDYRNLQQRLVALQGSAALVSEADANDAPATPPASQGLSHFHITFRPHPHFLKTGNDPLRLFRVLDKMGDLKTKTSTASLPAFAGLDPENSYLTWELDLNTKESRSTIAETFDWVMDDCDLEITELGPVADAAVQSGEKPIATSNAGDFNPSRRQSDKLTIGESPVNSSIQVNTKKLDDLVNIVGELVVTQTMLRQVGDDSATGGSAELQAVLLQLEGNIRELQQSVMAIRMLPVSFAFNRFARMVRDLGQQLGKKVELQISGEQSELDKTIIEKLIDPLTHLVRNCLDHGIEAPEVRRALGKPEVASLWLHAEHKGGNIIIQVKDDGQGLNREKIRAKAIEQGLLDADKPVSPGQIDQLICLPGFSTADVVSNISGRGVGMDVVRRNIQSLGGGLDIASEDEKGVTFTIRLPLTLAILDGMSITAGQEIFILPLGFIVEAIHPRTDSIKTIAGEGRVVDVRGEYLPVLTLHEILSITPPTVLEEGILVLLEAEGKKIALFVDAILGQNQVLIKSLESNYRKVKYASGATIMGNGRVALILDVNALVRMVRA